MDVGSIAICITIGALIVFASIGIGVCFGRNDERHNTTEYGFDPDIRIYVPLRYRDRGRDNGQDIPDKREIENVLYTLRIGASAREKRVIDYLIDKEEKHEQDIFNGEAHRRTKGFRDINREEGRKV